MLTPTPSIPAALVNLPPDLLLIVVVVFGVLGVGFIVGLIVLGFAALRPNNISADRGGKVDYSPRAKVEVTRPRGEERPEDDAP